MSIRNLRARLERLQAGAGDDYVIGQDRTRDRKRREELFDLKRCYGLTDAQAAEMAKFDAFYEKEDRDLARMRELFYKDVFGQFGEPGLTDAEQIEYTELQERYPADPDPRFKKMAEVWDVAGSTTDDRGRNNERTRARQQFRNA